MHKQSWLNYTGIPQNIYVWNRPPNSSGSQKSYCYYLFDKYVYSSRNGPVHPRT